MIFLWFQRKEKVHHHLTKVFNLPNQLFSGKSVGEIPTVKHHNMYEYWV